MLFGVRFALAGNVASSPLGKVLRSDTLGGRGRTRWQDASR